MVTGIRVVTIGINASDTHKLRKELIMVCPYYHFLDMRIISVAVRYKLYNKNNTLCYGSSMFYNHIHRI